MGGQEGIHVPSDDECKLGDLPGHLGRATASSGSPFIYMWLKMMQILGEAPGQDQVQCQVGTGAGLQSCCG